MIILFSTELETWLEVVRRKKEEAGGLRVLLMSVKVTGEKVLALVSSSNTSTISLAPISTLNSIRSGGFESVTRMPTHTATEKAVLLLPAASVNAPSSNNMYCVFLLALATVELDFRVFKSSGARAISILIPLQREVCHQLGLLLQRVLLELEKLINVEVKLTASTTSLKVRFRNPESRSRSNLSS